MDALFALLIVGAMTSPMHQKPVDVKEKNCLAANIYYEARGESLHGQKAVAQVTLNRVKSKKYPKTVCAVVLQNKQFSWTSQQPKHKVQTALKGLPPSQKQAEVLAYQQAQKVAYNALKSDVKVLPTDVLWYHTTQVNPVWNKQMVKVNQIGVHVFYQHKERGKI